MLGIKNCLVKSALPLKSGKVVVGQAFTAQLTRLRGYEKRYTLYETASACPAGKVLVYSGVEDFALLGENIATLMCNKGIKAAVFDGKCRDVDGITDLSMQVFCNGVTTCTLPPDLAITEIDVPIIIGGIKVNPGDVIVADSDGVVVIPLEKLDEVIEQAEWVAEVEHESAEALKTEISPEEFQKIIFKKKKPRP